MKNTIQQFAAMLILLSLMSCQKETGTELDTTPSGDKVKTYTEDFTSPIFGNSVTTYALDYDANDRIISFRSMASEAYKLTFTYNANGSFSADEYAANLQLGHEDYFLNANLYLDSTFQYNDTQDTSTEKLIYNASNQLITIYEYDYTKITGSQLVNTTTHTYDSNGNVIREVDTDGKDNTYTYYADLKYEYPKISPWQRPGKYNLTRTITTDAGESLTNTYTFDDKNRIATIKSVANDGGVVIKTYTYF